MYRCKAIDMDLWLHSIDNRQTDNGFTQVYVLPTTQDILQQDFTQSIVVIVSFHFYH